MPFPIASCSDNVARISRSRDERASRDAIVSNPGTPVAGDTVILGRCWSSSGSSAGDTVPEMLRIRTASASSGAMGLLMACSNEADAELGQSQAWDDRCLS